MNQGSALERMVRTFLLEVMLGNTTQLLINEGDESLQGFLITGAPFNQKRANRLGRRFGHTHTVGSAEDFAIG